ncbi:sugar phosphate nucleotidyltransferase, partial [Methyloparacoccus murrellii]
GGTGTRLWPVSREACPKPFIRLADGETLIEKTYRRAATVAAAGELLTVTNRDYYFMSKDALAQVASTRPLTGRYLLEPVGRNTAPAIALAAHWVAARHGRDACLLVLAADHLIQDPDAFLAAVARAEA